MLAVAADLPISSEPWEERVSEGRSGSGGGSVASGG